MGPDAAGARGRVPRRVRRRARAAPRRVHDRNVSRRRRHRVVVHPRVSTSSPVVVCVTRRDGSPSDLRVDDDKLDARTVPIHRPPPTFIGARPARAFDLDPWKEGRARKAAQRAELQRRVDESYAREAENREEKERLQAAYYAKASASRKARVQALRDGATEEEANAIAIDAGTRAFDTAVRAIDAEAEALEAYEARNAELRATAERRNAEALAAASAAEAVIAEEVRLGEECAEG